jgi:hypothetical protein
MRNEQYLALVSTGAFNLSVGDRIEYTPPRDCSTGTILAIEGRRYLIRFDDGIESWRYRDQLSYMPTAERIERLTKHYRETNHELGEGPEFRLGNIREVSARLHRR